MSSQLHRFAVVAASAALLLGAGTTSALVAAPATAASAAVDELSLTVTPNREGGAYFYGQGITLVASPSEHPGAGHYHWYVKRAGGSFATFAGAETAELKLPSSPVWDGAQAYAAWVTEDHRTVAVSDPVSLSMTVKPAKYQIAIAPVPDHVHSGATMDFRLLANPAQAGEHYHWYVRKPGEEFFTYLPGPTDATATLEVTPEHDGAEVIARLFDGDHAVIAEAAPVVVEVDDHESHATRTTARPARSTVTKGGARARLLVRVTAPGVDESVTGRVVATVGGKRLAAAVLGKDGRATITLPRSLKRGSHRVVVTYRPAAGSELEPSFSTPVRLRVR